MIFSAAFVTVQSTWKEFHRSCQIHSRYIFNYVLAVVDDSAGCWLKERNNHMGKENYTQYCCFLLQIQLDDTYRKRLEYEFHSASYHTIMEMVTGLRTAVSHLIKEVGTQNILCIKPMAGQYCSPLRFGGKLPQNNISISALSQ